MSKPTDCKFDRVSKSRPCPVCEKPDWCLVAIDGTAAICSRISTGSKKPIEGSGWLHVLGDPSNVHHEGNGKPKGKAERHVVAVYDYRDHEGQVLFQVVRFSDKTFPQRKPDGTWGIDGIERVLYRLPELLAADPEETVYIPEGEKDVDRLREFGLVATCNPGGAGKWQDRYAEHLHGRSVVVLVDNDEAGRNHATQVARSCVGKARSVKRLELPGLPPKGDVSDFLLSRPLDALLKLEKDAPEWTPPAGHNSSRSSKEKAKANEDREPDIDDLLAAYKPKTFGVVEQGIGQLQHLWPNMLILGCLSMVWSKPKIGKTRVYIGLMKVLWEGLSWPDGSPNTFPKGSKVLVCPYDRNHAEIAADMRASGIPDEAAVCPYDPRDPSGISLVPLDDPLMLKIIEICLVGDPAIKLIVVDTLTYASHKSLSKPEDMKAILDGIMEVAQKYHVALWCLCHENKEGEALGRRINERARVLMRLERYSEEDPTRLRLFVKEGNFPVKPAVTVVHTDQGVTFSPDAGVVGHQAEKRDDVARWLADYLWERGVGVEVDYGTLIRAAGEKGFAGKIGDDGRWTNPNALRRAIMAINDKSESLKDLHHLWIAKRDENRPGRNQPIVFYRIQIVPS